MRPLKTFAEVWNRQEERAARAMSDNDDITDAEPINDDDAEHAEPGPQVKDDPGHPEVTGQPDPGPTK